MYFTKQNYKNVVLKGEWNEQAPSDLIGKKACPICGYPMQYRYKNAYGLRLHICSNEPEICGFMTNDFKAGKMAIMKCDHCQDGYLIVKKGGDDSRFLGCTNYKNNRTGCNNAIPKYKYYEMMQYEPDPVVTEPKEQDAASQNIPNTHQQKMKAQPSIKREGLKKTAIYGVMYKQWDLTEVIHTTLLAVLHISEHKYYGVHVLADVLSGSHSQKLLDGKLNEVPEYGALRGLTKEERITIIHWLIKYNFILQTKAQYPVLHPTYEGRHYDEMLTLEMLEELKKELMG